MVSLDIRACEKLTQCVIHLRTTIRLGGVST